MADLCFHRPSDPLSAQASGAAQSQQGSQWRVDQELGYSGQNRFVLFYYEPRLQELRWRDSQSSGSGRAGWPQQFVRFAEQAKTFGISLGSSQELGDHVLLVDRVDQQACFAYREEAQEFLARRERQ